MISYKFNLISNLEVNENIKFYAYRVLHQILFGFHLMKELVNLRVAVLSCFNLYGYNFPVLLT